MASRYLTLTIGRSRAENMVQFSSDTLTSAWEEPEKTEASKK